MDLERGLNTKAAANYLARRGAPYSPGTLAVYRCTGRGPKFWRVGSRVFYLDADLDAWLAQMARHCERTSDYRRHEAA